MNLSQMVEQICQDTGYLDTDDRAFARTALRQRDDLLWRMGLWKDALVQVNLTVDPTTNADHAEGVIYLPEVIERVVAVRTADQAINVSGLETFYRVPYDKFSQTGLPYDFAKLNPGWFTWRGYLGLKLVTVAGDNTQRMRVKWRDDLGRQYTQSLTNDQLISSTALSTAPKMDTIVLVSGAGTAAANGVYVGSGTTFTQVEDARYRITSDGSGGLILVLNPTPETAEILYTHEDSTDVESGAWVAELGTAPVPTVIYAPESRIEVESLFKQVTVGDVALNPQTVGDAAGATVALADTASPRYQRIRLLPIPQASTALKVLGKAKYVPLDFDQQEPQVTGSHLALMAFAKHALRKRGGEHGAAQDDLQEAMGLLEVLKREEMQQEANNQRIIPSHGYGDAFFGPGRDGFFVG